MNRLDSEGLSVSFSSCSLSQLDDSYCSSDDYLEETGATIDLELPDGTKEVEVSRLLLSVGPVEGLKDHFTVRLATNHYSFTLGRSVAIRSYNSFLYIQVTLTTMWSSRTRNLSNSFQKSLGELNPYALRPSLPNRLIFYLQSAQRQCEILATFLRDVIAIKEHRANRALHLFLQTDLSLEEIKLNIDGLRDDDVPNFPLVDKRENSRNGFSQIFL